MVGKSKLFNGRKEIASSYSLFQSNLNNNEENSIARDVSVKSLNNSLFQSSLFSSEKKDETRDFLERSWSDVSTRDFLKYKAKSLIINMSEKIGKWKKTLSFNNKKNISFSNIWKHEIFQLENKVETTKELDIYLRGQFLAGVRDREMAERLAVLDYENLEMLVLRAREHEGLPFGFSGIREQSRNMFNQGTGRHIIEGEIRNLITPNSLNRSTLMATIRNDQRNQFSANTNNINEESDNYDLKYAFGYLNGEKIECLLDTGSIFFSTANGQPLNVIGSYTGSLRIGTNEVKLNVFVAVDLQHDCLIGFDYMGK
ncbi:hypothetical protein BpHYR1_026359, partial [Brachionus plicatilis]